MKKFCEKVLRTVQISGVVKEGVECIEYEE